jgi:hypothetical protein
MRQPRRQPRYRAASPAPAKSEVWFCPEPCGCKYPCEIWSVVWQDALYPVLILPPKVPSPAEWRARGKVKHRRFRKP